MNPLKHLSFGLCALLTTENLMARPTNYLTYTVVKGDTLGSILGGLGLCPLWGPNRFTQRTVRLNSSTIKNQGNYLAPKTKIKLPVETLEKNPDYEISATNEVSFTVINPQNKCDKKGHTPISRSFAEKHEGESQDSIEVDKKDVVVEKSGYGIIKATSDVFFSNLDVTDKQTQDTANLLSRTNHAYQLAWEQQWDSINKTFLYYRTEKHNYQGIDNKISAQSINLTGIGFGYEKRMSENFKLKLTLAGKEELFLIAKTISNLELQKAMIPQLSISPSYKIFARGPFTLFGDVELKYLSSGKTSDYKIQTGYGQTYGLSLTQKIKDFDLYGRSFYGIDYQDTSIAKKTTKILGIGFGISWGFGK